MKFSDVTVGDTAVGELLVSFLILLITVILIQIERKDTRAIQVILGTAGVACLGGYAASFFMPVDYSLISIGVILLVACYLVFLSIRNWAWHYVLIAVFALGSLAFMYSVDYVFTDILEPHQQIRIKVSLGLEDDPSGAGYNVNQSKIAIGSGGLTGKGFLNGTQTKLKYVPEQDTDFIFCTVGEEQGFIGASAVLLLFGFLILRLIVLAERQSSTFNRVYGYSVASIFFFHLAINIGMVTGLTPVIGIPLPFLATAVLPFGDSRSCFLSSFAWMHPGGNGRAKGCSLGRANRETDFLYSFQSIVAHPLAETERILSGMRKLILRMNGKTALV